MRGHHVRYSTEELAWVDARATQPRRELHIEFVAVFKRDDVGLACFKALCKRRGLKTGRTGQFEKGIRPHNTGKTMPFNANSAATRFKKGNRPHNTKFAGHERINRDGYIEISINEVNPHTGFERRYVLKHRHVWEQENGPVPDGMCLKSVDGDRRNCNPANWQLVPRALLTSLAGRSGRDYDKAPAEVKPTIMAIAKLVHKTREKRS